VAILEDRGDKGAPAETRTGAELAAAMGFARWSAELRTLVEAADTWRRWPLFLRPELARWTRGRVALLGDAAHPMTPFLAQGAAQAIEDAAALGDALADSDSLETALEAYQSARLARATQVQRGSRRQGDFVHLSGPAALARDLSIRLLGGRGMLARNSWLYR
jgi:salicylate hydroxylase